MSEHDEQFVFEMGYNKGFKDGIKGSIPKAEVRKLLRDTAEKVSDSMLDIVKEEYIPKADYENRLKNDLKAILVELQLEIEELDSRAGYSGDGMPTFSTDYIRKKKVYELIQQKINQLKENEDAEISEPKCIKSENVK